MNYEYGYYERTRIRIEDTIPHILLQILMDIIIIIMEMLMVLPVACQLTWCGTVKKKPYDWQFASGSSHALTGLDDGASVLPTILAKNHVERNLVEALALCATNLVFSSQHGHRT